jgi:hypothetical protein
MGKRRKTDVNEKIMTKITDKWLLDVGFEKKVNEAWYKKILPLTSLSPTESILSYNNGIMIWKQYDNQGMSIKTAADIQDHYFPSKEYPNPIPDHSFNLQYNTIVFERTFLYTEEIKDLWKILTNEEL